MQFAELRGPQPLPRGGPLFAQLIHAVSAGCDPKFAPKISKNPPKTRKIAKKARKLLYDTIICTTFGASDPSECDVNRIAVLVNLRNLLLDSNKRMSYFGSSTTLRLVRVHLKYYAMTGVGLLCYEV